MKRVVRLLIQPALWVCVLMIVSTFSGALASDDKPVLERTELKQKQMPLYASSPGHTVFGEYVGAHWCPPCMDSASPSLSNLKNSNPEEFTFVSFFESESDGWPTDSPIDRTDHIMAASTGYPTFSFADQQSGTCYKVGAAGTNYYDADFSSGGCMSADSSQFLLEMSMSLNSTSEEVTITLEATYSGTETSIEVYVYGAVTEETGGDPYDNGVRPHHNWREWLLNDDENGFTELTLFKDVTAELSWTASLNLVRAAGGHTKWENFWPVIALMDGPHTSYNTFYAAVDPAMGPLIDVGITEFTVENRNQMPGFTTGDILDLNLEIKNNGADPYIEGGQAGIYLISGSEEVYLTGETIGDLGIAGTQSLDFEFDTSEISMAPSGVTTFRAMLTNLGSDRNSSNNLQDALALHDLPPTASRPAAVGTTSFERGDAVQFESSAISNDLIDDMATMTPSLEYALAGSTDWSQSWVLNTELVGSGGNALFLTTIQTPSNAETGFYDIRIMWQDASGQQSEWLVTQDAFELRNALPKVLGSNDPGFAGNPTVKVGVLESISLVGLVSDAETQLSMLVIDSDDSEFKGWNQATSTISVQFEEIQKDPQGNPIAQGLYVSIDDGEDINNGMLRFNVIENGAPRWTHVPTQPVQEGQSASISLTEFLSDTDDDGNTVPASGLVLSVISNSDEELLQASISGQTLTVTTVDDDSWGVGEITVRADDGAKSSDSTVVFFVINVNDPPTIDLEGLSDLTLKANEAFSIDFIPLMSDIDDPSEDIWITATTPIPGAIQYDYLTGVLDMQWEDPGEHTVTVTLVDRHAGWSSAEFTVSVLDSMLLTWHTDDQPGDFEVEIDGPYIGEDATVTIHNVGPLELTDITTTWTICNSIVGVCHSAGSHNGLGPFVATPVSGNGMALGDYLTLFVRAVDGSDWDRESDVNYKVNSVEAVPPTDLETLQVELEELLIEIGEGEPTGEQQDRVNELNHLIESLQPETIEGDEQEGMQAEGNTADSGLSTLEVIAFFLAMLVFIGGGAFAGLYLSKRVSSSGDPRKPSHEGDESIDFEQATPEESQPEPAAEIHPPIPEGGLPPGWSIEQWQYYGEDYLKGQ